MEYLPGYDAWKTAEPDFALDEQEEECCITLRVNLNTVLDVNGDLDAQAGQVAKLVLDALQQKWPKQSVDVILENVIVC